MAPTTPQEPIFDPCTFEDSTFCEWQVETQSNPWLIGNGQTAVFGQAPLTDHTYRNVLGKYAYVSVRPTGGAISAATLGIRSLPRGRNACLDFWYQAFVSSDTTLNVYSQNGTTGPTLSIWSRPGTTVRDSWTHATINLGTIRASQHLMITGTLARIGR